MDATQNPTSQPAKTTKSRVIVVGAGFSGLSAAKTYLELQPHLASLRNASSVTTAPSTTSPDYEHDLLILDANPYPGGVWSRSRLYPGLVCQSPNGIFELSDHDITMVDVEAGFGKYSTLPGPRVGNYLERYAEKYNLTKRFRGDVRVTSVRRRNRTDSNTTNPTTDEDKVDTSGWILHTSTNEIYECEKLLISAGLYNVPNIALPESQRATYTGLSVHTRDMGKCYADLIAPPPTDLTSNGVSKSQSEPVTKHILVVGGSKSSIEACSLFLASNRRSFLSSRQTTLPNVHYRITWLIHPSPRGVNFLTIKVADDKGGAEAALTRTFGAMHPSSWDTSSGPYGFLHSGRWRLGSAVIGLFWWLFNFGISYASAYGRSENTRKLKPRSAWQLGGKEGWVSWLWRVLGGVGSGQEEGNVKRHGKQVEGRAKGGFEWEFGGVVQTDPDHKVLEVLRVEIGLDANSGEDESTAKKEKMEVEVNGTREGKPDKHDSDNPREQENMSITVVRAKVHSLQNRTATVIDGTGEKSTISADAVIWCTGWRPSVDFFETEEEAARLGAPVPLRSAGALLGSVEELHEEAKLQVLKQFPRLRQGPHAATSFYRGVDAEGTSTGVATASEKPASAIVAAAAPYTTANAAKQASPTEKEEKQPTTPYNLFRHIISPWCAANNDRSIAFVGMTATAFTTTVSDISALWAVAWCEGLLDQKALLPNYESGKSATNMQREFQKETAHQNAFMHLRWGSRLSRDSEILLEVQVYIDRMCEDLGLRGDRKRLALEREEDRLLREQDREVAVGRGEKSALIGKERGREWGWRMRYRAWKAEWFGPYTAKDYEGLVVEFVAERMRRQE